MLHVVTTIGQHPKGLPLHLRNLRWALQGVEHRIHVQTFAAWNLSEEDVNYVAKRDLDPFSYHGFWDEISDYLESLLDTASAFLFMQQDILFFETVLGQVRRCIQNREIIVNLEAPYRSIFRSPRERVYPGIWDGATLVPAAVIREALDNQINLGNRHKQFRPGHRLYERFRDKLACHFTPKHERHPNELVRLTDYLQRAQVETMFELGLYCFCTAKPCRSTETNYQAAFEMGECVLHFRNPESAHRDRPGVYSDVQELRRLNDSYARRLNDCALMFLLAGVFQKDDNLLEYLLNGSGLRVFREKMRKLDRHAAEWMSAREQEDFRWAKRQLTRCGVPDSPPVINMTERNPASEAERHTVARPRRPRR